MTEHTVLVVDDEPASLRAVQRALGDELHVLTAASGAQALEVVGAQALALMIVDQRMPHMTGTELLARSARQQPDTVRILLTGYAEMAALIDAVNSGQIYYYLTKPWEPGALRLIVRRGLERYAAEAERRRLIGALEQACVRAQRDADQKGRLLTLAAHELGTPLHVLSNALALLGGESLPPPASEWLAAARRSSEWLGRGLVQMTTAARSHNGSLRLHRRKTDVAAILDRLHATFAPIVAARDLVLHVAAGRELPFLMADPAWLGQALFNLLSNAVRFTPDGGTLTVEAVADAQGVRLSVTDTGIGIDGSVLDQVFEPFSAAAGDLSLHTSGRFEFGSRGLGLGLAVTKAIVDQHGGTIAVHSTAGVGSRFTISLPVIGSPEIRAHSEPEACCPRAEASASASTLFPRFR